MPRARSSITTRWRWLVGEEGHGIREILSHAHLTRLDFAIGSAGLMRQALTLALNHAQSRRGFGLALADQPMMTNILADLAIDSEASTLLAFRVARAVDAMEESEARSATCARLATPLAKFWNCKRAPAFVVEALECHGGNGFIEENPMARLYREAPLNAIWEGTSNMMCMDVLRSLRRDPATSEAFMAEVTRAKGADRHLDRWLDRLGTEIVRPRNDDGHARRLCNTMAYALQASRAAQARCTRGVRDLLPVPPAGRLGLRVRHARLDAGAEGHRRARHRVAAVIVIPVLVTGIQPTAHAGAS